MEIIWNEGFSVGNPKLDEQHKKLVGMINNLIKIKDIKVSSEVISSSLNEMTEYAVYHFETEERYMAIYKYPHSAAHIQQHNEFKEKTVELCLKAMTHCENIPNELLSYLVSWLKDHILHSDMKYKPYFA